LVPNLRGPSMHGSFRRERPVVWGPKKERLAFRGTDSEAWELSNIHELLSSSESLL